MRQITIKEAEELKDKLSDHLTLLTCYHTPANEIPINDFAQTCAYMIGEMSHDINEVLTGHDFNEGK